MRKGTSKGTRIRIIVTLTGVIACFLLALYVLKKWDDKRSVVVIKEEPKQEYLTLNGINYIQNENLETYLLMGLDKYEGDTFEESYNNNQQADFLILIIIDRENETVRALHLNRDTMAELNVLGVRGENAGTIVGQLALAHTYGTGKADSCRNTVKAVERLLYDIDIDHYIAFTMDVVAEISDFVGGVPVLVLDDMTNVNEKLVKGNTVNLVGDLALSYVRTRYGLEDSSNIRRMERQRQYLTELVNALLVKTEADDNFILEMINTISHYMISDCSANQLSELYENILYYENDGFLTLDGKVVEGEKFIEFYPTEESLEQIARELFCPSVE